MRNLDTPFKSLLFASVSALILSSSVLHAAEEKTTEAESLAAAITGGDAYIKLRYRFENVDQAGFANTANASTLRTNLGYKTGEYRGLSGVVEFQNVVNIGADNYNSTINGRTNYPVVADPEVTEVNQAYAAYTGIDKTTLIAGRKALNLDNQRFIGTVGWRQNDQTYDLVAGINTSLPDTTILYGYVWNVNRIFGDDHAFGDLGTDTHVVNVNYSGLSFGKLSAYGYFIDLDHAAVQGLSSQTIGLRFSGKAKMSGEFSAVYELEYANQKDYGGNPGDYSVNYFHGAGGVTFSGATLKLGYEILGSDNMGTASFKTPLATLHKFNGWADKFLGTPGSGLEDLYVSGAYNFSGAAKGLKAMAVYHRFNSEYGDIHYGNEIDLLLAYKINKNYNISLKYADYNADGFSVDTQKFWISLGANF